MSTAAVAATDSPAELASAAPDPALPPLESDAARARKLAEHVHDLIAEKRQLAEALRAAELTIRGLVTELAGAEARLNPPVLECMRYQWRDLDEFAAAADVLEREGYTIAVKFHRPTPTAKATGLVLGILRTEA